MNIARGLMRKKKTPLVCMHVPTETFLKKLANSLLICFQVFLRRLHTPTSVCLQTFRRGLPYERDFRRSLERIRISRFYMLKRIVKC